MATEKAPAEEVHGLDVQPLEDKEALSAEEEEKKAPPAEEIRVVISHFPDDMLPMVVAMLPSREAYRTSILSRANERMLRDREPLFLQSHLAPRPLLIGDEPEYIFIQPFNNIVKPADLSRPRPSYTHATLVKVRNNPKQEIFFNLPVKGQKTRARQGETPAPDFFRETLCLLDAEVVASHGRLVLARSDSNYFVCNPKSNRWVKLPLPAITKRICLTAAGFSYDHVDGSDQQIEFDVVLLVEDRDGLLVQTLSSRVGTWVETDLGINPILNHLPPRSPGIYCEQRCYWLSRVDGHLVCYDKGTGSLSMVAQPPLAYTHPTRFHATLGSTGGKLRFSCCDILDPHNKGGNLRYGSYGAGPVPAAIKVWKLNDAAAAGKWYLVHQDVMPLMYQAMMVDPMDFASASNRTMIFKRQETLRARNLDTGEDTFLSNLCAGTAAESLYWSYFLFPYFG